MKRENAVVTDDAIMNSVFLRYGIPNVLHSDQGKAFNNRLIDMLMKVSRFDKCNNLASETIDSN